MLYHITITNSFTQKSVSCIAPLLPEDNNPLDNLADFLSILSGNDNEDVVDVKFRDGEILHVGFEGLYIKAVPIV